MANTRKIESAEMLDKHIKEFIKYCENSSVIPSDWELCKFLNISPSLLSNYQRGEEAGETYKGYNVPLKRLQQFREHRLLELLERDPKASTAAIFQLKQQKNGGYTDAPQAGDSSATVTLRIEGVGGVEAFK